MAAPPDPPARRPRRRAVLQVAAAGLGALAAGGCGGSAAADPHTLRVAFPFYGDADILARQMRRNAAAYEAAHPASRVELIPVPDNQGNYATKIELMQRSPASAPDVVYQDTVMTNADVQAGYLLPLDDRLRAWSDWPQFDATARTATRAADGRVYGVLTGTDVRAVYYDKRVFARAGLPADWRPRDWHALLAAARTIADRVRGVTPINVYATKSLGEATTTQGLLMLLYGTRDGFYDQHTGTWGGDTRGLRDSLAFVDTVFRERLGPSAQAALDPTARDKVVREWLPEGRLGIALGEGSWTPKTWLDGGAAAWPGWHRHIGVAAMPTQHGPGQVSVSGGWMLGVSSRSRQPDAAFRFVTRAVDRRNHEEFAVQDAQIPVRRDVARDPRYRRALPTNTFFTGLLAHTRFRPTQADYPLVSSRAQVAMESVMTGSADPAGAARAYAAGLVDELGEDKVGNRA